MGGTAPRYFLSNMDYAQVAAAVITQEYIDGLQNDYLWEVQERYPNRFLCCGMVDVREAGYLEHGKRLIAQGFTAIKLPANRFLLPGGRVYLTSDEMMQLFREMEKNDILLSIDLADGDTQVAEMEEVIAEYPALRIAIGHFGMVTRPGWREQIKLARHDTRSDRVRWDHVAL